ncbi:LysR family transcriptional regulator [Ferrimonas sp. YFM]|uniref:LysR family transcriptional regulator n=1 Tax=Ferrimonas sp. YFM TaxID=3028878 RepID=UPI0025741256|nr:LysR family transcriptional regulator [Ferrimonas sp. YFM]
MSELANIDFFSLQVFKSVYETRNAKMTAQNLGVSAPKISRCLAALRIQFDDELFYRRQSGLMPTPKAERIYQAVVRLAKGYQELQEINAADIHVTPPLILATLAKFLPVFATKLHKPEHAQLASRLQLVCWNVESMGALHRGELDIGLSTELPIDELTSSLLKPKPGVFLAAHERHPIWRREEQFSLEMMAEYPFVYNVVPGFNDHIDPLETFFRNHDITFASIEGIADKDNWYARLVSTPSLTFCGPASFAESVASLPGMRVWQLPRAEQSRLHEKQRMPQYRLIERSEKYRRYDDNTRTRILALLKDVLN